MLHGPPFQKDLSLRPQARCICVRLNQWLKGGTNTGPKMAR
jgi:hypothetical protein